MVKFYQDFQLQWLHWYQILSICNVINQQLPSMQRDSTTRKWWIVWGWSFIQTTFKNDSLGCSFSFNSSDCVPFRRKKNNKQANEVCHNFIEKYNSFKMCQIILQQKWSKDAIKRAEGRVFSITWFVYKSSGCISLE